MSVNENAANSKYGTKNNSHHEETAPIIDFKEYKIRNSNAEYYLKIEVDNKYIYFTAIQTNVIADCSYQNKYDLDAIIRLLYLLPNKYTELSQVLKFLDKAYSMNKISITNEESNITLLLKIPIGFEEEDYKLILYKTALNNNEILNQLIREVNTLKKSIINMKANSSSNSNNNVNYNNNMNTVGSQNSNNNNINSININNNLVQKVNELSSQLDELQEKLDIKEKEVKDIYAKLNDKNSIINQMNKTYKYKDNQEINLLKIKDEEINKKLNEREYEINNKFIDKDNELNEINKKLIEKDKMINEINNKLNDKENEIMKQNILINELKQYINKINQENNSKILELREIIFSLDEMKQKKNIKNYSEKINNNNNNNNNNISPENLKFKYDLVTTNTKGGLNDLFEAFICLSDNKEYLASPNKNNFNIDIITLFDNKFQFSLKGHLKKISCVRYFKDNFNNNEYLVSADENFIVIVWDISNKFNKKFTIETKYTDIIYSCLLTFVDQDSGFLITSTYGISDNNDKACTKIYSMQDGELVNYFKNTNNNSVYYLLYWFNKKNKKHYIIQFAYVKIIINSLLDEEIYAELIPEIKMSHYSGFISETQDKVLLYSSSKNGYINLWDLYNKKLLKSINTMGCILCHMIQWNEKFAIVADYNNRYIKIVDLELFSVVKDINGEHEKELKSVKKIFHPIYGDSLLTAGNDCCIKLWGF